jgi:virginiamycin B lyase
MSSIGIDPLRALALYALFSTSGAFADSAVKRIDVPGGASSIAFGAGAAWVTLTTNLLARIDAQKLTVTVLRMRQRPTGVTVGAGSVWVGDGLDGTVTRIDPATTKVTATIDVGGEIDKLATVGNEVWVFVDRGIVRIDPATNQRVGPPLLAKEEPYALAVAFDSIWVSCPAHNQVVRLDLPGKKIQARIPVGLAPGGLAALDGAIWVANRKLDTLARIDPATNGVVREAAACRRPITIAAYQSLLWVPCLADKSVYALSPGASAPSRKIPVGTQPGDIVAGGGALWVSHIGDAFVTRIDPSVTDPR